ncbi:DNA-binding transcriptional regulator, MarR family [Rhizobiales bacterium GAS191]|jgi:DNA-binding MarR family transcriptional regulator|nr:DNA-binding transcriptional regulator, MarR family [Rhizobiales bacterium GAS113]SEC25056.1 DNA-binding transcriptional regulator, MarR family [Rhizobiales bacterium GAS188]SED00012.1 DNA-binding transcriptional regulator, MarR family [Rhizobiales bacterium GAS191]
MGSKLKQAVARETVADGQDELAPVTGFASSRLMVLANLLRRGAILRYRRLLGLSSTEFGLIASLGRRAPMSVARIAELMGVDKGQISRALSGLVSRKLVSRSVNAQDNREVLVALTAKGLKAHETMSAAGFERNDHLLSGLSRDELSSLFGLIDRLTERATEMLEAEKAQG